MALTAAQIVSLSCQVAKCPGYVSQAGQLLNAILQELCQTYDFDVIGKTHVFNFDTAAGPANGKAAGAGPNILPADYLRAKNNEAIYSINGVQYVMINVAEDEYDALVQSPGLNNYPTNFYVDLSTSPPGMYVWMPASGAYRVVLKYFPLMPDIASPETSTAVPWFPNQTYLLRRLAGELMLITGDDRAPRFLGGARDGFEGATAILEKYLKLKDDPEGRVDRVQLDRRRFGGSRSDLPNTKNVGW